MFLLDTNILAEVRKLNRAGTDPRLISWAAAQSLKKSYLSVITLLEIKRGVLRLERRDAPQAQALLVWEADLMRRYRERIVDVDQAIALQAAALQVPNPLADADALIAATALVHNLTVVTRNTRHFEPTGVRLLNPFE